MRDLLHRCGRPCRILFTVTLLLAVLLTLNCAFRTDASASQLTMGLNLSVDFSNGRDPAEVLDGDFTTYMSIPAGTEITVSSDTPMTSLYILWDSLVPEWTLKVNGTSYTCGENGFLHEFVELPEAADSVTIVVPNGSVLGDLDGVYDGGMRIADLYAFGSDDIPDSVQRWEPPCEEADILVIATHSDDDILYFGAIHPIYAAERGLKVQTVFLMQHWVYDSTSKVRAHEQLNGLWTAGDTCYPIMGNFRDYYTKSLQEAQAFAGEDEVELFLTQVIRETHPLVVVTHDLNGEYGHGQHKLNAAAAQAAITLAADPDYDPESAEEYGVWTTPKYYIHYYSERQLQLDVNTPLTAFDGKTALEVAKEAFQCHTSQLITGFAVAESNMVYGLYRSTVGADTGINDLMENITDDNKEMLREVSSGIAEIYTAEDLEMLRDFPYGSYVLKNDIDMTGIAWKPVDFYGTLDGDGHAILNLSVTSVGDETKTTYDGNWKNYETSFAGLFGVMDGAAVKNLTILGMNVDIDAETDCFVGGIAGFAENSTISNCSLSGQLSLVVFGKMFGVGGFVGYGGSSLIQQCTADVTLICIDEDTATRDEQFMGGAFALGFINLDGCSVTIRGYDSDHGYVHNGGLVGMYRIYVSGEGGCYIRDCNVDGTITFFEDNSDRRAYCDAYIGEDLYTGVTLTDNTDTFTRDERFSYDQDLLPHSCTDPTYTTEDVEPADCRSFPCTRYTCTSCGYSELRDYRLPVHTYDDIVVLTPADTENTGFRKCHCSVCGDWVYETIPVVVEEPEAEVPEEPPVEEPVPTPEEVPEEESEAISEKPAEEPEHSEEIPASNETEPQKSPSILTKPVLLIAGGVLLLILLVFLLVKVKRSIYRGKHVR